MIERAKKEKKNLLHLSNEVQRHLHESRIFSTLVRSSKVSLFRYFEWKRTIRKSCEELKKSGLPRKSKNILSLDSIFLVVGFLIYWKFLFIFNS